MMFDRKLDGIVFAGELAMREMITAAIERNAEGYPLVLERFKDRFTSDTSWYLSGGIVEDQMRRLLLGADARPTSFFMAPDQFSDLRQLLESPRLAQSPNSNPLDLIGGALAGVPVFLTSGARNAAG